MKNNTDTLKELQKLPLRIKIDYVIEKILEFVEWAGGWDKVYLSFSGGKDSRVLLDIILQLNPYAKVLFVDTGMEFKSIVKYVKNLKVVKNLNLDIMFPKTHYKEIVEEWGFPVISKKIAMSISRYREARRIVRWQLFRARIGLTFDPELIKEKRETMRSRLFGTKDENGVRGYNGVISKKWRKLAFEEKFPISEKCCYHLKHEPINRYNKMTGRYAIVGTLASESSSRTEQWVKEGCNTFNESGGISKPLSIWTEKDIKEYIKLNNIELAQPYNEGHERTGCTGCLFGIVQESKKGLNRIQKMEKYNPKLHKMYIKKFNYDAIMNEIGVPYEADDIKWFLHENITIKEQAALF